MSEPLAVLDHFHSLPGLGAQYGPPRLELVVPQGFSGARVWKVISGQPDRQYALRRWPREFPIQRLDFIHRVLRYAQQAGPLKLAAPLDSDQGVSIVERNGERWELTPWLTGAADFRQHPSPARLRAAMQGLAQFHAAARHFAPQSGPAPGLQQRLAALDLLPQAMRAWQLAQSAQHPRPAIHRMVGELFMPLVGHAQVNWSRLGGTRPTQRSDSAPSIDGHAFWRRALQAGARQHWPLQPCLRDVWHAHAFFDGSEFVGFIDFGSLNWEHPAADVGRLLGSLVEDDAEAWQQGMADYGELNPLTEAEKQLAGLYDQTNAQLSVLNWAFWIYVQRREFDSWEAVEQRLTELTNRMHAMTHRWSASELDLWLPPSRQGPG
jgi:aminoglycoside phosphotransferase (APT) family kinase protein